MFVRPNVAHGTTPTGRATMPEDSFQGFLRGRQPTLPPN
jgi:hypothetical protein